MTDDERMQRIKAEIVATAAEAFAAAQFARFGYDVSIQWGATQPECDLIISERRRMLKISVKGSADGGWNVTQSAQSDLSTAARIVRTLLTSGWRGIKPEPRSVSCSSRTSPTTLCRALIWRGRWRSQRD